MALQSIFYETSNDIINGDLEHVDCPSLLAYGFNQLWCRCLNAGVYEHFYLHHSDIGVRTKFFVDVMLEDMYKGGFDAIHVPTAIKDDRGITSTAVMDLDNVWSRPRRLTTTELSKLPPVFGLDEMLEVMGPPLPNKPCFLPNTGMLLVKLDTWSWDFPGFHVMDRVKKESVDGKVVAVPQVVPEDWNFGWWMANNKLKVGATKRVANNHYQTRASYPNDQVWGQKQDELYLDQDKLDSVNKRLFRTESR